MSTLKKLQSQYIQLENAIVDLWPKPFKDACSNCTTICCRPHMAEEAVESRWLHAVSAAQHGDWFARSVAPVDQCRALGRQGCCLKAGKPPFCYSFYCDRLLTVFNNGPDLIAAIFISGILSNVCRLSPKLNLVHLNHSQIQNNLHLISQNLLIGEQHLALYVTFLDAPVDQKHVIALKMVCQNPKLLTNQVAQRADLLERITLSR